MNEKLTLGVTIFVFIVYLILIVLSLVVLYNDGSYLSSSDRYQSKMKYNDSSVDRKKVGQITLTTFLSCSIPLAIVSGAIYLVPYFEGLKKLLSKLLETTTVFFYSIFLLIFLRCFPKDTLDNYWFIFLPVTLVSTYMVFSKALKRDYLVEDVDLERIKMMCINFCFMFVLITYYNIDPGNMFNKYFGKSFLISVLVSVFMFLYLATLYVVPFKDKQGNVSGSKKGTGNMKGGFSDQISDSFDWITLISIVLLFLYGTLSGASFKFNSDMTGNPNIMTAFSVYTLVITFLFSILVSVKPLFQDTTFMSSSGNNLKYFRNALQVLFTLVVSGLVIGIMVSSLFNVIVNTSSSSVIGLILNFILLILIGYFANSVINVNMPSREMNSKKQGLMNLISSTIFYIPCLFTEPYRILKNFVTNEYKITTMSHVYALIGAVLLFGLVGLSKYVYTLYLLQGGEVLEKSILNTDCLTSVSTYENMNGNDDYYYKYAISFWMYVNSFTDNSQHEDKYKSIINYGYKPNVMYNGKTNTLIIVAKKSDFQDGKVDIENLELNNLEQLDQEHIILFKYKNLKLQKWNNIVINYDGGTLDIFINSELIKSMSGMIPYITHDNLTVGESNGVNTNVTNIVYFKKPLTIYNIYLMYNLLKKSDYPKI